MAIIIFFLACSCANQQDMACLSMFRGAESIPQARPPLKNLPPLKNPREFDDELLDITNSAIDIVEKEIKHLELRAKTKDLTSQQRDEMDMQITVYRTELQKLYDLRYKLKKDK